jgi:hypothetical protein
MPSIGFERWSAAADHNPVTVTGTSASKAAAPGRC